jgi:hypothetical protein
MDGGNIVSVDEEVAKVVAQVGRNGGQLESKFAPCSQMPLERFTATEDD